MAKAAAKKAPTKKAKADDSPARTVEAAVAKLWQQGERGKATKLAVEQHLPLDKWPSGMSAERGSRRV